uniref:Uncharacterized protein n=1 Tax=Anopheles coluzzii TaxID=1518534 RepID=A0A8W7PRJ1_ANOCL
MSVCSMAVRLAHLVYCCRIASPSLVSLPAHQYRATLELRSSYSRMQRSICSYSCLAVAFSSLEVKKNFTLIVPCGSGFFFFARLYHEINPVDVMDCRIYTITNAFGSGGCRSGSSAGGPFSLASITSTRSLPGEASPLVAIGGPRIPAGPRITATDDGPAGPPPPGPAVPLAGGGVSDSSPWGGTGLFTCSRNASERCLSRVPNFSKNGFRRPGRLRAGTVGEGRKKGKSLVVREGV